MLIEIAKQVPGLAVMAFIVHYFLNHMREREDQVMQHQESRDAALRETLTSITDDCHRIQQESLEVCRDLREQIGASQEITRQIAGFLQNESK